MKGSGVERYGRQVVQQIVKHVFQAVRHCLRTQMGFAQTSPIMNKNQQHNSDITDHVHCLFEKKKNMQELFVSDNMKQLLMLSFCKRKNRDYRF